MLHKYDLPNDKVVADLFCGVGSLGLEALSRGAEFVTFVEQDQKVAAILEKNKNQNQLALFSKEEPTSHIVIPKENLENPEWNEKVIIQGEKEITGIYISHNPIEKYQNDKL